MDLKQPACKRGYHHPHMRLHTCLGVALLWFAFPSLAQKGKPAQGQKKIDLDLDLPAFGSVPTGAEIEKPKAKASLDTPTPPTSLDATYQVVRLQHGYSFVRAPSGATPAGGALTAINLSGKPPRSERFTTVVRVKCPQRTNAPIEVLILDPRGDTAMSASGEVNFKTTKQDEADYTVDWDRTPLRAGGNYQVLVRVTGQVIGTFPLQVLEPAGKK